MTAPTAPQGEGHLLAALRAHLTLHPAALAQASRTLTRAAPLLTPAAPLDTLDDLARHLRQLEGHLAASPDAEDTRRDLLGTALLGRFEQVSLRGTERAFPLSRTVTIIMREHDEHPGSFTDYLIHTGVHPRLPLPGAALTGDGETYPEGDEVAMLRAAWALHDVTLGSVPRAHHQA